LEIFQRAGMRALRTKSIALTGFMQKLIEEHLPELVEIITPSAPEQRGCQLSLRIARPAVEAMRCQEVLTAAGVIGDWREPDVLRLAPIPLYNSFADVLAAVEILARALRGTGL
jgi:kynureninase